MAKSDYLEDEILNHVLRNASYVSPSTVYVGLFTQNLVDSDTSIEFQTKEVTNVGSAYSRLAVSFEAPVNGQTSNNLELLFNTATVPWGSIVHFGILDSASWASGNLLYHAPLTADRLIATGDQFRFPVGQLIVGES